MNSLIGGIKKRLTDKKLKQEGKRLKKFTITTVSHCDQIRKNTENFGEKMDRLSEVMKQIKTNDSQDLKLWN